MSEELKHKIYSATECLSEQTMFNYIDNTLSSKERHLVEKHMLDCELCSDAMEGLELVKNRNKISTINKIIDERITLSPGKEVKIISINYKTVFSIAAGIALLIGGIFFFKNFTSSEIKNSDVAELKEKEMSPPPPPPAPAAEVKEEATGESEKGPSSKNPANSKTRDLQSTPSEDLKQTVTTADPKQQKIDENFKSTVLGGAGTSTTQSSGAIHFSSNRIVPNDGIAKQEDDKKITLTPSPSGAAVNIPENLETEREQKITLDETKKSEEKDADQIAANSAPVTYAWSPAEKPDQNQEQKNDKSNNGDEIVLAKKAGKEGQNRNENKGKDKNKEIAAKEAKVDQDVSKVVAAQPQYETTVSDKEEVQTGTNTPATVSVTTANNSTASDNTTTKANKTTATPGFFGGNADSVYTFVETMPEYPGGHDQLMKFVTLHLNYPAKDDEGKVIAAVNIELIINTSGKVTSAKLISPKSLTLEKQVIVMAGKMPLWKPGKQSGKNVSVKYYIPITILVK